MSGGSQSGPIVHVGYHKTGTTWFQDIFYPAVRNRPYIPRSIVRAAFLAPGALEFDPACARQILGAHADHAILCEENLTGGLHNGGLAGNLSKDVARRIKATLPDAQIVLFVRDPVAMIASAWVQYVKGGGTYGLRRYLFGRDQFSPVAPEQDEAPGFRLTHFDYHRLVAHYDALFGAERVHVFRYEDFRADPHVFTRTYAARFGMEIDMSRIDWGSRNPSLSRILLWGARAMNLFTRRAVADKSWLIHIPGWYGLSRRLLRRANASGRFGRPLRARDLIDPKLELMLRRHYAAGEAIMSVRIATQSDHGRHETVSTAPRRHEGYDSLATAPAYR